MDVVETQVLSRLGRSVTSGLAGLAVLLAILSRVSRSFRAIQFSLQPPDQRGRGRLVRTTDADRWHGAGAQLAHDFFPGFRVSRNVGEIDRLQRETTRFE